MSSPSPQVPNTGFDWRKLPTLFKEWKEVIVILGGAVAAALTTLGVKAQGTTQIVGYAITILLLIVGGYVFYRVKRRREIALENARLREAFESRKQQRTAFRGLYPYQEGDVLPGHQRKREAQTIFTQITDNEFTFGIVCGDSGCGKTSLLRCAVQSRLKEAEAQTGLRVLYISSPQELVEESGQADGIAEDKFQRQLIALRRAVAQASVGAPLIVIIDQFEEFFMGGKAELRADLGACLNELIHATPPSRILCAVRREYLLDMRDLAPQLPEPISIKTLFTVKNFTVEDAADVVKECAKIDGVALDATLPATLAEDLAEDGHIRPPELQIVCTALVSNPTLTAYRLRGGARGILSHHIQNAVAICDDPKLGSQILRTLCNFTAHSKRHPQTITEILSTLDVSSSLSQMQARNLVTNILIQFEVARLVLVDTQAAEGTYALVHDYLVDAVASATSSDLENRTEKANQFLKYYISEYSADSKTRVPLRRYRFIKKHADKSLLFEPRAKRLLNVTRKARYINLAVLLLSVSAVTAAILIIFNTRRTWKVTEITQLPPEEIRLIERGSTLPLPDGRVLNFIYTQDAKYAKLWDPKTAKLLLEKKADDFFLGNDDQFLIGKDKSARSVYAIHLKTNETYHLPVSATMVDSFNLRDLVMSGESGTVVMLPEVKISNDSTQPRPMQESRIKIWSILEQKELSSLNNIAWLEDSHEPYLDKSANRLIGLHWAGPNSPNTKWKIWNARTGEQIADLVEDAKYNTVLDFVADEDGNKLVVVTRGANKQIIIQLMDLRTGSLLIKQPMLVKESSDEIDVDFSKQGDFIILRSKSQDIPLAILNTFDLLPASQCSGKDLNFVNRFFDFENPSPMVSWSGDDGTYVWDITSQPPKLWQGVALHSDEKRGRATVYINKAGDRGLIVWRQGALELHDLSSMRKIVDINLPGDLGGIVFTFDGHAIDIQSMGGTSLLYSLKDGSKLAELLNIGPHTAFYDAECNRVNVWTSDGRVLRYTESITVIGRWSWPTTTCRN